VVSTEAERAEEQLRHLIGEQAYAVWEETGRIQIGTWFIRKRRGVSRPLELFHGAAHHCVGAAWGFKGAVPLADQVIALCLWLHADEEAVSQRAFPSVGSSMPRTRRAEHWDAIVSGEPMPITPPRTSRCMDATTISRLVQEYEGQVHTAEEWNRLLGLSPTTYIKDTSFAKQHLIRVDYGPIGVRGTIKVVGRPALFECVSKKEVMA